jgi:hypothetical protein
MLKKIKTIDLPRLKPIETESVPKKKQQSLKEWAMAGGGVPTSHHGREHVWHKKAQKYAAGGEVYNTVPDMADGGQIIDGPAYAKGGAVKKAVKDAVEGVVEGIKPVVDRINMHFKDVTKRVPELQEGAQKVKGEEMTRAEYEKLVNKYKPVKPYEFVPKPATRDEAYNALHADKRDLYGTPSGMLKAGHPVGLRLDIPAYSDHGVWVQPSTRLRPSRIGYENIARRSACLEHCSRQAQARSPPSRATNPWTRRPHCPRTGIDHPTGGWTQSAAGRSIHHGSQSP